MNDGYGDGLDTLTDIHDELEELRGLARDLARVEKGSDGWHELRPFVEKARGIVGDVPEHDPDSLTLGDLQILWAIATELPGNPEDSGALTKAILEEAMAGETEQVVDGDRCRQLIQAIQDDLQLFLDKVEEQDGHCAECGLLVLHGEDDTCQGHEAYTEPGSGRSQCSNCGLWFKVIHGTPSGAELCSDCLRNG